MRAVYPHPATVSRRHTSYPTVKVRETSFKYTSRRDVSPIRHLSYTAGDRVGVSEVPTGRTALV